jgi:hypothetical protein
MTDVLKHRFTSPKLDGADTQQVQPSHWNDGHKFQGGNDGEVLTRDLTDLSFGAKWTPITIPPAIQEVPGGGINNDVLTRDLTVPTFGSKWAAPAASGATDAVILNSDTGAQNNWNPSGLGAQHTLIYWLGTAAAAISGIRAGVNGQRVTIKNRSSNGAVFTLANLSTSSALGNRFLNVATSAPTPVALDGFITLEYVAADAVWIQLAHEQGAWITPPFSAADYSGLAPMTWTVTSGNIYECRYRLVGRTLNYALLLIGGALSGTASTQTKVKIPGGFLASGYYAQPLTGINPAATQLNGYFQFGSGGAVATLFHDLLGGNWVIGTTQVQFVATLEVT